MIKSIKTAILGVALASSVTVIANAADQTPTPNQKPPQIATNPGIPHSATRNPGPKTGPSTWIPSSTPTPTAPAANQSSGQNYSKKGFGPAPN